MKSLFFCSAGPVKSRGETPMGNQKQGFTVVELLVIIATVAVLGIALLPVLARDRAEPQGTQCFNNFRQLAADWLMYADDNHDYCPGNVWGYNGGEQGWQVYQGKFSRTGTITSPTNWISGWLDPGGVAGNPYDASTIPPGESEESDNTNWDLLVDPSYASMGDYTKDPLLFICPACAVQVEAYGSGSSPSYPKTASEVRSVSMNTWAGYFCEPPAETGFKKFSKTASINGGINPATLFVFMDERGESIDDGAFETEEGAYSGGIWTYGTTMANWPTDYHNGAGTIGFADGHVEAHRWIGTPNTANNGWTTTAPQQNIVSVKWGDVGYSTPPADLIWLETHASCPQ